MSYVHASLRSECVFRAGKADTEHQQLSMNRVLVSKYLTLMDVWFRTHLGVHAPPKGELSVYKTGEQNFIHIEGVLRVGNERIHICTL